MKTCPTCGQPSPIAIDGRENDSFPTTEERLREAEQCLLEAGQILAAADERARLTELRVEELQRAPAESKLVRAHGPNHRQVPRRRNCAHRSSSVIALGSVHRIWSLYDMLDLGAAYLLSAINLLGQAASIEKVPSEHHDEHHMNLRRLLDSVDETCRALGFVSSSQQVQRIRSKLDGKRGIWETDRSVAEECAVLNERLIDELQGTRMIVLTAREASLYKQEGPFSLPFSPTGRLSAASDDMVEAAKCLALGRCTAAVFHLMRAMEVAVRMFGVSTGAFTSVPGDKEWGKITRPIHALLFPNPPAAATPSQRVLQGKYGSALMALDAVRVACRNPTMHAKVSYSEQDAQAIHDAVRAFLGELEGVL